jgi:hypothetical protein
VLPDGVSLARARKGEGVLLEGGEKEQLELATVEESGRKKIGSTHTSPPIF